jgi:hypothetical protein
MKTADGIIFRRLRLNSREDSLHQLLLVRKNERPDCLLVAFETSGYIQSTQYGELARTWYCWISTWYIKIDSCKAAYDTDDERDEASSHPTSPRLDKVHLDGVDWQSCRINSGADVVISNVLPFLDKVCREDYYFGD